MKRVFKYRLAVQDSVKLSMPVGAELLTVQVQYGEPMLWALVDPSLPTELRTLLVRDTGQDVDSAINGGVRYVGTFQLDSGNYVGHVFERLAGEF